MNPEATVAEAEAALRRIIELIPEVLGEAHDLDCQEGVGSDRCLTCIAEQGLAGDAHV